MEGSKEKAGNGGWGRGRRIERKRVKERSETETGDGETEKGTEIEARAEAEEGWTRSWEKEAWGRGRVERRGRWRRWREKERRYHEVQRRPHLDLGPIYRRALTASLLPTSCTVSPI